MSKFDKIRERLKKFTSERRGGKGFVAKSPGKKDKQTTKKDKDDDDKMKMRYVTREEFRKEMDDLKKHIDEMMDHKNKEKEEMASQVATEIAVEMSKTPAVEPIKHSPEEEKAEFKFKFACQRKKSTLDRVMESIINKN